MSNPVSQPDPPELLTKAMIKSFYLPISIRALDRWISVGRFPRAEIALGGKIRYWRKSTVLAWIEKSAKGAGSEA
jgi:predicted DNA-binding transcriptional regulator AlpA